MFKAILFDLDGTLVDDSMDTFLPPYFEAMTKKLSHLVAPDKLVAQLHASTRAMVANRDSTRTLAETFAADFFPNLGVPRQVLMPLLDDFYERDYPRLRTFVKAIPQARGVVGRAIERGYKVIIATMPVFPHTAIRQRMEWGGIGDLPFALITDYETMHASKPSPAYYSEIAARIDCAPGDCLMVGNEAQNDILPAKRVGMQTFFVTGALDIASDVPATWRGTLEDLTRLL